MNYNKLYIQVNNLNEYKRILNFLSGGKIEFETLLEKEIFIKSNDLLLKVFGKINNINGIVIGNEFCEHLNFDINEIKQIIKIIGNKEVIINTSILTIYNQEYYKKLFVLLKNSKINFKVVINDIGFIKLLNKYNIIGTNIIIGRIILKHRKIFNINNKTLNKFDDQSINNNLFNNFFKRYGIDLYAIDILPQGNYIENYKNKYLYFPWGYYTSSRGCVTKSIYSEKNYIYPLKGCDRPCIGTYIKFKEHDYLFGKGNTVFYKSIDYITLNDFKKYNNFIFQPFFPM